MSLNGDSAVEPEQPLAGGVAVAWFLLGIAILFGTVVRLLPFIGTDFPLNDGGLFATMIQDLIDNGLLLPASTSYNGLDIPFGYPPLAFYVAALLNGAFGVAIPDILRGLPVALSILTIPAVYWLAQGILSARTAGALTALAFALLPRGYLWMVTGGGITRALGFLLAIVALGIAWRLLRSPAHRWWTTVVLGLVGGLAALAHPQAAIFMAASIVVFLPWAHGWRTAAVRVAVAGVIGLLVVSPWLFAVVSRHGLEPLLSAMGSGGDPAEGLFLLLSFRFTELIVFDVIGLTALAGAAVAIYRKDFLLPLWLAVVWIVDARAGATFSMVPLAILVGYLFLVAAAQRKAAREDMKTRGGRIRWALAFSGVVVLLVMGNYLSSLRPGSPLYALSNEQRLAMASMAELAGPDAQVAVLTGSEWEVDATSEWFPTISGLRSVATVQGYEWLGDTAWENQLQAHEDLQSCAGDVLSCVLAWADEADVSVTHVYIPQGELHGPLGAEDCCLAARHSVELVPGARVVYEGPGATVVELP